MSRTDAHIPLWVLETGPEWHLDFDEHHDHRDGVCDIDIYLAAGREHGWRQTHCYRQFNGLRRICSCRLCGNQPGRKQAHRRERTWWRSTRAQLLAAVDREALDFRGMLPDY
jgi:hypothetical protein